MYQTSITKFFIYFIKTNFIIKKPGYAGFKYIAHSIRITNIRLIHKKKYRIQFNKNF